MSDHFELRRADRFKSASRARGRRRPASADLRLAELIRNWRRIRNEEFGGALFFDPAWDILLELFVCEGGSPVSATSLCLDSTIPQTTLLRWIKILCHHGFIARSADAGDGRRVFVSLTEEGRNRMRAFLRRSFASSAPDGIR